MALRINPHDPLDRQCPGSDRIHFLQKAFAAGRLLFAGVFQAGKTGLLHETGSRDLFTAFYQDSITFAEAP